MGACLFVCFFVFFVFFQGSSFRPSGPSCRKRAHSNGNKKF